MFATNTTDLNIESIAQSFVVLSHSNVDSRPPQPNKTSDPITVINGEQIQSIVQRYSSKHWPSVLASINDSMYEYRQKYWPEEEILPISIKYGKADSYNAYW